MNIPSSSSDFAKRPRAPFRLSRSAFPQFAAIAALASAAANAADPGLASVLSGCEPDYPPYCVVTPDHQANGFSVELLRAALKAAGREVVFKIGPWAEIKQELIEGRLHALPMVGRTPEREAVYDFTFPYLTVHGAIVVREGTMDIRGPADLKGRQVAVLQGDNAEEYLRRANLGAVIVPLPSFDTALRELSAGKHDAVVIQRLVALHLMQKAGLNNLMPVGPPLNDFTQSFCFAVRKGDAGLLAALNEGLAIAMADGTFRMLHAKWFSALEAAARKKSRIVVGGDSDYPPYEFLDRNGQPAGYNVDLTRAIARQMGMAVDIRLGNWNLVRQNLESGDMDVAQGMFYSVERDRDFDFSPQHEIVQHAIVVRSGTPVPADMKALAGKTILVMADDMVEDLALQHGYAKQLVPVPSQQDALRLLAAGEQDCARVAKMTQSLLGFTEQREQSAFETAKLADLVAAVLPPAVDAARKKGIALSCDIPADLPPVFCRRSQIERVVAALLANAVEAWGETLDAGRLELDAGEEKRLGAGRVGRERRITIRAFSVADCRLANGSVEDGRCGSQSKIENPKSKIRLTVEDNGAGIPVEIRERVFDPFFTTKDRTRHSGLGLWISRSFAQEHGGALTVESPSTVLRAGEEARGTRVHVDLPVDEPATPDA